MSSIDELRAKVLAHKPTTSYTVCFDRQLKDQIDAARLRVVALEAEQARGARGETNETGTRRTLGEKPEPPVAERIAQARDARDALIQQAADRGELVELRWHRSSPNTYRDWYKTTKAAATTADGKLDENEHAQQMVNTVLARSFDGAFASTGESLDLTWDEISSAALLSAGDWVAIENLIQTLNMGTAAVPFTRATSGGAAQN